MAIGLMRPVCDDEVGAPSTALAGRSSLASSRDMFGRIRPGVSGLCKRTPVVVATQQQPQVPLSSAVGGPQHSTLVAG
jgi:hypothetical protein